MINPNRPKAFQSYLRNDTELKAQWVNRVWFLKVENGKWPAIVFNEWDWSVANASNISFEKWIDIFPVLIDVVVKYEEFKKWYDIRGLIRKKIWKFNWKLTNDWEWTISFLRFLAPSYNHDTNEIVFWWLYLLKQNFDFTPIVEEENVNDSNQELTEQSNSNN